MSVCLLSLPGIGDSGPAHWQTLWELQDPRIRRVQQRDWAHPVCADWVAALQAAVELAPHPPILIAHSLGCLLVAHWAARAFGRAAGALLAAPADPEGLFFPPEAQGFSPVPLERLPFPSILVASDDDPFGEPGFAQRCAAAWDSRLVMAGPLGHLNADSGVEEWPAGRALLHELIARVR